MEGDTVILTDAQVMAMTVVWKRVHPRIKHAINLHNVAHDETRLRKFPWPHVAKFNALVETIVRAKTLNELKRLIAATPKPLIRRLGALLRHVPMEDIATPSKIPDADAKLAEDTIISLLLVDDYASPGRMLSQSRNTGSWSIREVAAGFFAPTKRREWEKSDGKARRESRLRAAGNAVSGMPPPAP